MTPRPYEQQYPVGSYIRIADRAELEVFQRTWRYHNPLRDEQLSAADRIARVLSVGFYHGGDILYELEDIPGPWHERLLYLVV